MPNLVRKRLRLKESNIDEVDLPPSGRLRISCLSPAASPGYSPAASPSNSLAASPSISPAASTGYSTVSYPPCHSVSPHNSPPSPIYYPTSPAYHPTYNSPPSSIYHPTSPAYHPLSPGYSPASSSVNSTVSSHHNTPPSPVYHPTFPAYHPTSPAYSPTSPIYSPRSPIYHPTSTICSAPSPHHPKSPNYSPSSPPYPPTYPNYSPPSPPYPPTSPNYSPLSSSFSPASFDNCDSISSHYLSPPPPSNDPTSLPPSNDATPSPPRSAPPHNTSLGTSTEAIPNLEQQVNAFQIAEQLLRAAPLSEIEQMRQLEPEDLLQTSIASAYRAVIGFTFARDGTNSHAAEKRRLQAEKEGSEARVAELERELSIERGLMTSRFNELEGKNAQLHVLEAMLEEEKQRNDNLQRKVKSLPAQVTAALDAFQTSREFQGIKDEEYSKGFDDCRAMVAKHFPGLDLSFLNVDDPDTAARRE